MAKYTPFGKEAMKAMIDKETTLPNVAKEIGISTQYLHDILKGNRPGEKQIPLIARKLGIKQ
jgi:hypothetical protein